MSIKKLLIKLVLSAFLLGIAFTVPTANAQSFKQTDNPQSLVGGGLQNTGGGLQPTGGGLQGSSPVLGVNDVYQYNPDSPQTIKLDLNQAAKQASQGQSAEQNHPETKSFKWPIYGLSALGLLALFGLAKLFDRPSASIFTK